MPFLRMKEIEEMSREDRSKKIGELRTELVRLKTMIRAGGTIENPARVSELRKAIARILTVQNEDRLGIRVLKKQRKRKR